MKYILLIFLLNGHGPIKPEHRIFEMQEFGDEQACENAADRMKKGFKSWGVDYACMPYSTKPS